MAGSSEETPAPAVAPAEETTEPAGQHVEVDQGDNDHDSAIGDGDA